MRVCVKMQAHLELVVDDMMVYSIGQYLKPLLGCTTAISFSTVPGNITLKLKTVWKTRVKPALCIQTNLSRDSLSQGS